MDRKNNIFKKKQNCSRITSQIKDERNQRKAAQVNLTAISKFPGVLAIQKKKLMIAIGKMTEETANISQEDTKLVEEVVEELSHPLAPRSSKPFDVSLLHQDIKATMKKHAQFTLSRYLNCADEVSDAFSRKTHYSSESVEYVIAHARQFGDPIKTIFEFERDAKNTDVYKDDPRSSLKENTDKTESPNPLVKRVKQLIAELRVGYDETMFQTLNIHTTSFALLLLRRCMKTQSMEYNTKTMCKVLVLEAYLSSQDDKTKKNILNSCVKYMEWYDIQLPGLFFKVVELYGIEVGQLWDVLSTIKRTNASLSLIALATEYYDKWQRTRNDPAQDLRWFPYSRVVGRNYYERLSNKGNVCLCTVLDSIIKRTMTSNGPAYKYVCPNYEVKEWAERTATVLIHKIQKYKQK